MKYWPLFVSIIVVLVGYITLQAKVNYDGDKLKDHCAADDKISVDHGTRITRLEEAMKAVPRIEDKVDSIYTMLNRLPAKIDHRR